MRRAARRGVKCLAVAALLALILAFGGSLPAADTAVPPAKAPVKVDTSKTATPDELPVQGSVTQYGITWTFNEPVGVGRFITGDYYVVGPVTVVRIDPAPGKARNGSSLNPRMTGGYSYDNRPENGIYYDAGLNSPLPISMRPGDSLVSTISHTDDKNHPHPMTGYGLKEDSESRIKTAAVLTCLAGPVPPDTFRPSYSGRQPKLYRFRDLHLDMLPSLGSAGGAPKLAFYARVFERPWIDHVYGWGSRMVHPTENMPDYGREIGRAVGEASLLVMCNDPAEDRRKVLVGLVQYGIDLWGIVQNGGKGWPASGGFGNGRKWPLVFAGMLFHDEAMCQPKAEFGEDQHTAFGHCWTGAGVLFTGQFPDAYQENPGKYADRGPYETLPPGQWPGKEKTMSEGYRRTCSVSWVGQALAARLMKAEKIWNHDAFFAYVDRWMTENDTPILKAIKDAYHQDYHTREGDTYDPFVKSMWGAYRSTLQPPATETWKVHKQPESGTPASK